MTRHDTKGRSIIIGAGLAGLAAALRLADHEPTLLLSADPLGEQCASAWAQGGVAAAIGEDDEAALHAADTLAAGDALCRPDTAARITASARGAIDTLIRYGVRFDRTEDGQLKLGLEAAHSRRRIVHAHGDGSGREIVRALATAARRHPNLTILEGLDVRRILRAPSGQVAGLLAADTQGAPLTLMTSRAVLATGGIGGLYLHTTNSSHAVGRGLAMAARAGASLADMEFVQFHPTALNVGLDPMPLVSEAVRGEGAILINDLGERFLANEIGAELAPRDVVARGVWRQIIAGRTVFLDSRQALGDRFTTAFPQIAAACKAAGIDPASAPIPIRPAAHYHMGGVSVDYRGRTDVEGLWACGEVASTGLHGANRLASNSLLEAVVCGTEVADDLHNVDARMLNLDRCNIILPPAASAQPVRPLLDRHVGVLRNRSGLEEAIGRLHHLANEVGPASDPALTAIFIAHGALKRQESRGGHYRSDFPAHAPAAERSIQSLANLRSVLDLADAA